LGLQVRLEVERVERVLKELGHERIMPQINLSVAQSVSEAKAIEPTTIESEPEISEVSLWRRTDPHLPAMRAYLGVNSRFLGNVPQRLTKILEVEAANLTRIEPAFHGHSVVLSDPFSGVSRLIALVAVPLGNGEVSEVVVAHVNIEKLQRLFSMDGLVQSSLADREGTTLANSEVSRIGHKENEAGRPMSQFYEHMTEAGESGIQSLLDPSGNVFYGGFRRISSGGLVVVSTVSDDQAGASLQEIRKQLVVYIILVFAALGMGRYLFLNRKKIAAKLEEPQNPALLDSSQEPSVTFPVAQGRSHGDAWLSSRTEPVTGKRGPRRNDRGAQ